MRVVIAAILLLFASTAAAQTDTRTPDTRVAMGVFGLGSGAIPAVGLLAQADNPLLSQAAVLAGARKVAGRFNEGTPLPTTYRLAASAAGSDSVRLGNSRLKARARWTTFFLGAVAVGLGVKWNADAGNAYDEMNAAYAQYQRATTSAVATYWHAKYTSAEQRGNSAGRKRNVSYGAAGALLGVSLLLTVR